MPKRTSSEAPTCPKRSKINDETYSMSRNLSHFLSGNTDDVREMYEYVIQSSDAKDKLLKIVRNAMSMLTDQEHLSEPNQEMTLWDGTNLLDVEGSPHCIGRSLWCDFRIDQPHISRLQCVIIPHGSTTYIIDPGSLNGTFCRITERDGITRHHLKVGKRLLKIKSSDTVELTFGFGIRFVLNPKICVICEESPRNCRYTCGHFCTCMECYKKIKTCPICRSGVQKDNAPNILRAETNPLF